MVDDRNATEIKKRCFIVCPIGAAGSPTRSHADWLFHEVIEHVFDRFYGGQFDIVRADKIDAPGMIDAQIIEHLLEDELVIADMSELNPNAFYEIGVRHMKELPIIHMVKKGTEIPFDVKLFRAIPFSFDNPSDLSQARADLRKALESVFNPAYKADNPVIRARGVVKLQESSSPEAAIVQSQIEELESRLIRLETSRGASAGLSIDDTKQVTITFNATLTKSVAVKYWASLQSFFGERLTKVAATTKHLKFTLEDFESEDAEDMQSMASKLDIKGFQILVSDE